MLKQSNRCRDEGEDDMKLCICAGSKHRVVALRDCILCAIIDTPCEGKYLMTKRVETATDNTCVDVNISEQ